MSAAITRTDAVAAMRDVVVRGANVDGGWPYYEGRSSRLEPTCWALLALASGEHLDAGAAPRGRFLTDSQRADGLLLEASIRGEGRPNYGFNGLAVLVMSTIRDSRAGVHVVVARQRAAHGEGDPDRDVRHQPAGQQAAGLVVDRRHVQLGRADDLVHDRIEQGAGANRGATQPRRRRRASADRPLLRARRLELREFEHARAGSCVPTCRRPLSGYSRCSAMPPNPSPCAASRG